jgi:hypothetical protein
MAHTSTSLWDLPMPAAARDPVSSKLAAREFVESGKRDRDVLKVAWLVSLHSGMTSRELSETAQAREIGMDRYACARRLKEAETIGLVRRGPMRTCRSSGKACVTWLDVEQGGKSEAESDA